MALVCLEPWTSELRNRVYGGADRNSPNIQNELKQRNAWFHADSGWARIARTSRGFDVGACARERLGLEHIAELSDIQLQVPDQHVEHHFAQAANLAQTGQSLRREFDFGAARSRQRFFGGFDLVFGGAHQRNRRCDLAAFAFVEHASNHLPKVGFG
ncbi:MAG TPA: hypothetical protein VGG33_12270, partial [Polyangia bacterium]